MPSSPDTLFEEAKCFTCRGLTLAEALKIALYRRWLLAVVPTATVTPESLEAYASCFRCYTGGSLYRLYKMAILDQITDS